jgi:hypothetical protein
MRNPPAFPRPHSTVGVTGSGHVASQDGLTLLDYFAATIVSALLTDKEWNKDEPSRLLGISIAYAVADLMLTTRAPML